jgi:hypothetical protein
MLAVRHCGAVGVEEICSRDISGRRPENGLLYAGDKCFFDPSIPQAQQHVLLPAQGVPKPLEPIYELNSLLFRLRDDGSQLRGVSLPVCR